MDKRRDDRVKKKLPVRFYFEGNAFLSFTGDLSRRGIFIQTPHPFPTRRGINIEIEGKGRRVFLAGFIVWSKDDAGETSQILPSGMGVQLLNYQKDEYQALVGD
ncbi:MAG: PilZ domain-containing protein [Candidatus Aminicenantes bacterium]|nr:PilZ domain-containing protein [Candidatus Aminicenantes bacterium]